MKLNNLKSTQLFILSLPIIAALLLTSCGKKEEIAEEPVAQPVKSIVLGGGASGTRGSYPGTVRALETADLAFLVSGQIVELPIKRGQFVNKGELIARLDPQDYEQKFTRERAKFVEAQSDLNRYRKLYEEGVIPVADLKLKESEFEVTRANMKVAEKALNDTYLKAPFSGVIARQHHENFQNVQAKDPVVRLQDLSRLKIEISVPESDVAGAPADPESVEAVSRFDNIPDREFPLAIEEWETEADAVTQTFLVKFTMAVPEDANIMPGMSATVVLANEVLNKEEVTQFVLPSVAVAAGTGDGQHVWVVDEETMTVHKKPVQVGEVTGVGNIKITGGLASKDRVVVAGTSHLREGMKVTLETEALSK
jgi:RND family efflux transporter MFP subunit